MFAKFLPKATVGLSLCFALHFAPALAAPGDLDISFGSGGEIVDSLGHDTGVGHAVLVQPDGKIVVAGRAEQGTWLSDFGMIRYLPDGTRDSSFGQSGRVCTGIGGTNTSARSLILQPDGKLVIAGRAAAGPDRFDFALARYDTNGAVDSAFGKSGLATLGLPGTRVTANSVALQSDGKIVVAGEYQNDSNEQRRMVVARCLADGTLDTSFGDSGKVIPFVGGVWDSATSVVIQPDGKIVVAGSASEANVQECFALVRLHPNGTLDNTFGNGGKVTTLVGGDTLSGGQSVLQQDDGKIVLAGFSWRDGLDMALARYHPDGTLDSSFGEEGMVVTSFTSGAPELAYGAALQGDGRILVTGTSEANGTNCLTVVRYLPNGALDASFGSAGRVTSSFGRNSAYYDSPGRAVAVQSDGKIIAVGGTDVGWGTKRLALARYFGTTIAVEQTPGTSLSDSASIDFGSVATGSQGATRSFTVRNPSTATPLGLMVSRDGAHAEDFSVGQPGASSLGPGQSTTFAVTFAPTTPGLRTAAIHIATSLPDENPFDITVIGTGVGDAIPGALDATFGSGGKVLTSMASSGGRVGGLAVQSDGKLLVAGGAHNGSNYDFALLRYQPNGSLDSSFGNVGRVLTPIGNSQDFGRGVAVQQDGKIVVVGDANNGADNDLALVRYQADGNLDPSFGNGGKVTTTILSNSGEIGRSVAVQPDGKILVAGHTDNGAVKDSFALVRYMSNGSLDNGFGSGGKVTTSIGSGDDHGYRVLVQSDGKILVAGDSEIGGNRDFALVRYHPNGTLDTSFGNNGKVVTSIGLGDDGAQALAVQGDGKIVLAGFAANGNSDDFDFALVRYLADGSIDPTFGTGGKVVTDIAGGSDDTGNGLTVLPGGRILVVGSSGRDGSNYDFALAQYLADGSLDTTFGSGGKMLTPVGTSDDFGWSVAVQSDGNFVVGGDSRNGSNYEFALVRYIGLANTGGTAPEITTSSPPFGMVGVPYSLTLTASEGVAPYSWSIINGSLPAGLALSSLGSIEGTPISAAIANFTARVTGSDGLASIKAFSLTIVPAVKAGDLDLAFGTGGKVTSAFRSGDDCAYSAVVQSDGKILVAGYTVDEGNNNYDFALARYQADGSLDTSFGIGGKVTTDVAEGLHYGDFGRSIALQSDGKILVAGEADYKGSYAFALARYHANGTLDTSFGDAGTVRSSAGYAKTVLVQNDGKILLAGQFGIDFGVERYLPNGTLDTSFGSGGKVTTDLKNGRGADYAQAAALQSDGKIVVVGYGPGDGDYDIALVRYLLDGSLDPAFGNGGEVMTPVGTYHDLGWNVAVQSDGKIIVAGEVRGDFALLRYLTDGSLDAGFGTAGIVMTPIGNYDASAKSLAVQGDGKIVMAGYVGNGQNYDFALARYLSNGALDSSFGTGGKVVTPIGNGHDYGRSVVLQADDHIVVAGSSDTGGGNDDFALVRYLGSLAPGIAVEQPAGTRLADGGASVDFGGIDPGATPVVRTFTVKNPGAANLTGLAITRDGANSADFTVESLGATSLAPGASLTFTVSFSPAALGSRTATLHIANNDSGENPFDITLTGIGGSVSPLQAWRLVHFGSLENSGDGADLNDFENDGVQNIFEYAFGGDPKTPDAELLRPTAIVGKQGHFTTQLRCDARCTDLTYRVQFASQLDADDWMDVARSDGGALVGSTLGDPLFIITVLDSGPGLRMVTISAPHPSINYSGQVFCRVLVSY